MTRYIASDREDKRMVQEKWLVDSPTVIDLDGVTSVKIALVSGQIDVVGHDEPTARIEVHSISGKDLKVSLDNGLLDIDHPQLRWDNFIDVFSRFRGSARADVSLLVPRAVALKLGVVNASALVSGLTNGASISTVNGDLVVDGLAGDVTLNSVNGELAVRNHRGAISVHTVTGDATASGEISKLTADGVSGDVFLDIAGAPDAIKVNSVSGSVTARLEAGHGAQYTFNTASGSIQLDDSEIRGVRGSYTGKYGTLERSWVDLRVNTVSGNIAVLHSAGAA